MIKGKIRGNGSQLATYLLDEKRNGKVTVFDIQGTSQKRDLKKSLIEMSLTSELTKTDKGLYHAQINPRPDEDKLMTRQDWLWAAELLENELGFDKQKRIMVMHEKKGRIHMHVAWERYNHETGKMISNRHSRYAQNRARIEMEKEFKHLRTPDKNLERPELRKILSEVWARQGTGNAFVSALGHYGYTVARSEGRRSLTVINSAGRSFDLVRETNGAKTKEMRERLKGIHLPNDKEVIESIREQQKDQEQKTEREKARRELIEKTVRELKENLNEQNKKRTARR